MRNGLPVTADVKGVDDILEPKPHGRVDQLGLVELAAVQRPARVEEPAPLRRGLPVFDLEVLAQRGYVWHGELVQRDEGPLARAHVQQDAAKRELVARDVPAEADDVAPVAFWGGRRILEDRHSVRTACLMFLSPNVPVSPAAR